MIEIGITIELKKEIVLFRVDFRDCSDSNQYQLNLMLFFGLPRKKFAKNYFELLQLIKNKKKGFLKWSRK